MLFAFPSTDDTKKTMVMNSLGVADNDGTLIWIKNIILNLKAAMYANKLRRFGIKKLKISKYGYLFRAMLNPKEMITSK